MEDCVSFCFSARFQPWLPVKQGRLSNRGVTGKFESYWEGHKFIIQPFLSLFFFQTAQLLPLLDRECITSHPRQKTDQASRVMAKGPSFTFRGAWTVFPWPTYPAETAATLGRQSCDFFQQPGSRWASGGFSKGTRKEIWAAVHNSGLGSLTWISEGLIILDRGESGIEG